ncbi:MAG: hypothetical protein KC777_01230 [Cyanobacteria bacterium HKST-UBA02]|nr:hypothetical protein [Cyanobacteria bacterium HKST-UBA02]
MAFHTNCKAPGIPREPARIGGHFTNIGGTRSIAIAENMKGVSSRIPERVLVRLDGGRRARDLVPAILAAHGLLRLDALLLDFDWSDFGHASPQVFLTSPSPG